mmetsp:Transcript_12299/g.50649  ORF Transcript_12299/g.50649 Transcript_12299/m.50649 type:complete len:104 (-) Transcript_12299:533-844(-)
MEEGYKSTSNVDISIDPVDTVTFEISPFIRKGEGLGMPNKLLCDGERVRTKYLYAYGMMENRRLAHPLTRLFGNQCRDGVNRGTLSVILYACAAKREVDAEET